MKRTKNYISVTLSPRQAIMVHDRCHSEYKLKSVISQINRKLDAKVRRITQTKMWRERELRWREYAKR